MPQLFSNDINSLNTAVNTRSNCAFADDRSQILSWLSPPEPRFRHQDIQDRRVENIGEWLLQTEEFRRWHTGSGGGETDNAFLFCYGDPGVGKTYISSLVIDRLCDQAKGQNAAVACFYFDFAAQKEQSPTSMLGALLKQVVRGLEEVPGEIVQAYEDQKKVIGGRGPQLADIVKMLQTTSSEKRTFICIDALDECAAGYRVKLLDSLNKILQKSPGTRVFATGRPHIQAEIQKRLSGRVTSVSIAPRKDDITRYLHTRLNEDTTPDAMDSILEAEILKIPEDISEIFLLVSLNIDAILQETTIHSRRQKLCAMTDGLGLGGAYGATLGRIKGQGGEKSRLGMAALMWISHSERPLKVDELCHALAVEIGSPNLNTDNVPSIETLLACCQGFIAVGKDSTVRLIHFTLQEYLRAHPEFSGTAHSTMAETCLSYLNSQQVKDLSPSPSLDLQSIPFLGYSSLYWGIHAKRDLSDCAKLLALKLFDDCNNHISTKILLKAQRPKWYARNRDKLSPFSGLHCASIFGIAEIVAGLVELERSDISQEDCTEFTPLMWAAHNGHEEMVKTLLGRGDVHPNKPNEYGQTPLSLAAENGHEGVVQILLGRDDVNPDEPNEDGQTPLSLAAENGHEGVVKILFGRGDVDPDKPNECGQTSLSLAAENGCEGVVQILLGRGDVNPDTPNEDGQTPLSLAAENGHEGVVQMLLGRGDVNPDKPDYDGQTPLSLASENGCEGIVKILLQRDDVNPDKPENDGHTPLSLAAYNGHEGVVQMLLGRGDVNPNTPNEDGQTPFFLAAGNGCEGVVQMLLGRGDVNPNTPNKDGQTPLSLAAENGCEGVLKMLLGRGDVNPNTPNKEGQTPLSLAAENGCEGVLKMLLGRGDINPDEPDYHGQTPLSLAAENGCEGVVKILLQRGDVNPDGPDYWDQTPLSRAAENGCEGVVKILLQRDDVDPKSLSRDGQTPLWWAAENGHEGVVEILLGQDKVDPNEPDYDGRTPLYRAAENGCEGVVKILLQRGDVNPDGPDYDGKTPLSRAAKNGHEGVVEILLSQDNVYPNEPDYDGQTPLSRAAENGHEGVVKMLLERDDVNPDKPDKLCGTPQL